MGTHTMAAHQVSFIYVSCFELFLHLPAIWAFLKMKFRASDNLILASGHGPNLWYVYSMG